MNNQTVSYYVYVFNKTKRKLILQSSHETLYEAQKIYKSYIKLSSVPESQVNIISVVFDRDTQEFETINIK